MKPQIPIYRAKKIDIEEYVIGYLSKGLSGMDLEFENFFILPFLNLKEHAICQTDYEKIDPSTLAIHFPDMLDSEGNKIFVSLSEDGNGGDEITATVRLSMEKTAVYIFKVRFYNQRIETARTTGTFWEYSNKFSHSKVTGIHTVGEQQ